MQRKRIKLLLTHDETPNRHINQEKFDLNKHKLKFKFLNKKEKLKNKPISSSIWYKACSFDDFSPTSSPPLSNIQKKNNNKHKYKLKYVLKPLDFSTMGPSSGNSLATLDNRWNKSGCALIITHKIIKFFKKTIKIEFKYKFFLLALRTSTPTNNCHNCPRNFGAKPLFTFF